MTQGSDNKRVECSPDDCPWANKIERLLTMEEMVRKIHDSLYYENGNRSLNGRLRDLERCYQEHVSTHKEKTGIWDQYKMTIFSIIASSMVGAVIAWVLKGHI